MNQEFQQLAVGQKFTAYTWYGNRINVVYTKIMPFRDAKNQLCNASQESRFMPGGIVYSFFKPDDKVLPVP